MNIQKMVLVALMTGAASVALAEVKWQKISFNHKEVTLYMDSNGIKPRVDEYQNRYLETAISRAYVQPRTLKSGKHYSHYNEVLSVDCKHGAYAASKGVWRINNKDVQKSTAAGDDWNKYDSDDRGSYAVTARAICKQYQSFLG